ncbi:MAG: PQQ-binding-like beta-propeller repeat protein [Pseudomonadota bacterium]
MFASTRRSFVAASVAASLLALVAAPTLAADAWSQQGGNAGATSHNADQSVLGPGNLAELTERWARDLDVWNQATEVAIADGQVYVTRRLADPDTTIRTQLLRLDLATGATIWKANAPDSFATPLLTSDLVIVAGNGGDSGATATPVQAFERSTGKRRWQHRLAGAYNTLTSPHLMDGVVYLAASEGEVMALDAGTGAVLWKRKVDLGCCGVNAMAVGGGVVVVAEFYGLVALDPADGHERWRYLMPAGQLLVKRPLVVGDTALAFDGIGNVHAIDAATGSLRWERPTPRGDLAVATDALASDGLRVYALNGAGRATLSALDLATGDTLWSTRAGAASHDLVVSNGVLYMANERRILAFDPATGASLPIAEIKPTTRWGDLAIAQGHLVMSGGPVRAFGLPAAR